ncbi:FRG domain-containing protein [Staphylococcus simulans]
MDCDKENVEEIVVTNIEDLIRIIEESEEKGKHLYFRGESKYYDYRKPTLYRQTKLIEKGSEYYYRTLLNELGRDDYGENTSLVRLISELQHYGAVTRMLDVTINPLVALYFALDNNKKDGYLYIYSVDTDKEKFDTGHTIAIKSALNLLDQQVIDDFMTACEIIEDKKVIKRMFKTTHYAKKRQMKLKHFKC